MVHRVGIEDAERAFQDWRRQRVTGAAIPEALWERAADVARVHGVARTARRLRLNQTRLKHRCDAVPQGRVDFVEIRASELTANEHMVVGESVVELEDATGNRLRLVLRGASVAAVTAAAKELWGSAR
jgi:hypothetical protein